MNIIKYVNAAGKTARVKVSQPSYAAICTHYNRGGGRPRTMADADWQMLQAGFRRAGLRWRKAA